MKTGLVSAIVPTFNRAHLIPRAIESVLRQTYAPIELIVVDDGSSDATEAVVESLARKAKLHDIELRYLKKENGGCASARNRGIDSASGEFIAFLDSDDEWTPMAIQSLVGALEGGDADFVYSPNIEHIDDDFQFTSLPAAAERPVEFATEHYLTTRARPCSILYRRHVFAALRFDEQMRYNEDSDLLQRVALKFRAAYSPVVTGIVHHHAHNKSRNQIGLYRALLAGSDAILQHHPAFAQRLGSKAVERRRELVKGLVEALLIAGDVDEARRVAGDTNIGPLRLLLAWGVVFPIQWRSRVLERWQSERRKLVKLYRTIRPRRVAR